MYIVQLLLRSVVYSNSIEELNPYKEINISVSKCTMYLLCHTMYLLCHTMYLFCHTMYLLCHTMYLLHYTMYLLHYTMYLLQVTVNDSVLTDQLNIILYPVLINDEPPVLQTNGTIFTFIEQGGPINIVGPYATITDRDLHKPEHDIVDTICISILHPLPGDQLLTTNISSDSLFNITATSLCINVTSCDNNFDSSSCYRNYLKGVWFNNSEDEPNLQNRSIVFTVSSIYRT